jgi:hypothetical protein
MEIKRLCFFYYGEDSFLMVVCERDGNTSPSNFPSYHSLSSNAEDHRSFEMIMNSSNITASHLVRLFFYYYF